MSLNITIPQSGDMKPKIMVFGVGGAGGNAVNNMISSNLEGVEFWVANTDAQALENSLTTNRIQLGTDSTKGLGAGSYPEIGKKAAEESLDEIETAAEGCNMVFITAGMGGGTGTGAAPVIAKAAHDRGLLTVGVVTKPFHFEGARRMKVAELGLEELQKYVDTLIIIPNQNLFRIATEKTTFADAFKMADNVLHSGVRGVTDLITMPGLINLDFADIRTVMSEMGKAMMGTGEAEGEDRAIKAAESAISNPLLDNSSMKGAKGVLINITGGSDMTLFEVDEAANRIREEVQTDANIIFGSAFNNDLEGKLRVSVVATGIDAGISQVAQTKPNHLHNPINSILESQETAIEKEDENDIAKSSLEEMVASDEDTFIAPQAIEPDDYFDEDHKEDVVEDSSDDRDMFEEIKVGLKPVKLGHPATADNIDGANDSETDREETESKEQKKKKDFFDIPAFIRRKMNG